MAGLWVLAGLAGLHGGGWLGAQDERPPIFINEVIANNGPRGPRSLDHERGRCSDGMDNDGDGLIDTDDPDCGVGPLDIGGGTPDMIEIYNASDQLIRLGQLTDEASFYLSDTLEFCVGDACPEGTAAWRFPEGRSTIPQRSSIVVFCDRNETEGLCELHATFQIDSGGREPITLWGPENGEGRRAIVDRVWLPPLRRNVSFGRFPDGAGPAPVPVGATLDHFVFNELGSVSPPTFGSCVDLGANPPCSSVSFCEGRSNLPGANLEPRVSRIGFGNNSPRVGEAVEFTVRVRDDKAPTPGNIRRVEVRYRVDEGDGFGTVQAVEMRYDSVTGVQPELCDRTNPNCDFPERPLDRWSLWTGSIPGQSVAGARVEFHFTVEDREGLSSTSPRPLCEELFPDVEIHGPCDRSLGGAASGEENCQVDVLDVTCIPADPLKPGKVRGGRFIACDAWLTYTVGYVPAGNLEHLVINEVVPLQEDLLADRDPGQRECVKEDLCPMDIPDCCKMEDFIELHNTSTTEEIDLAGLWLADRFFRPRQGWEFPEGSKIDPGEYLIVWTDNDGGKCPDEMRLDPPCFWECPDPTDPAEQHYHTSFNLDFSGDQIFLFDREECGFGVIHGVDFSLQVEDVDKSLSLLPDGDRRSCFVLVDAPTPGEANVGEPGPDDCPSDVRFRRGDATSDCGVDLSDAVRTLNWLFLGGGEPEAPGPFVAGPDPTDDDLEECVYSAKCR
ncbi:MAG: lamin tail domain-containing protein [Planctomycetota bacterium]|nr:lamin tail domain-containing protein [Planctomycetota bacterium]